MALVRFATICDHCKKRSREYEAYPHCRECGDDVCPECSHEKETDDETNTTVCFRCACTAAIERTV